MGVLKVFDLDPEALAETEILEDLRRMLTADRDAAVVANCLIVLREVDGGV
jgi:vesicle coat complex subunit